MKEKFKEQLSIVEKSNIDDVNTLNKVFRSVKLLIEKFNPNYLEDIKALNPYPNSINIPAIKHTRENLINIIHTIIEEYDLDNENDESKNSIKGNSFQNIELENNEKDKKKNSVFVIHGRNEKLRKDFFSFLRSAKIEPIEWSEAVRMTKKSSPYVGEILDAAFENAQAVIVLLTPDDEVKLKEEFYSKGEPDYEKNSMGQARPNVLFEAGMAIGKNEFRTLFVQVSDVKPFSDIVGRHVIKLDNSTSRRQEIFNRLKTAGCLPDITGHDWHTIGDFLVTKKAGSSIHHNDIIITIKDKFKIEMDEWARIIYHLGKSNYEWSYEQTILEKTGIPIYHLSQFLIKKPRILERKNGKTDKLYKLTKEAKSIFTKIKVK